VLKSGLALAKRFLDIGSFRSRDQTCVPARFLILESGRTIAVRLETCQAVVGNVERSTKSGLPRECDRSLDAEIGVEMAPLPIVGIPEEFDSIPLRSIHVSHINGTAWDQIHRPNRSHLKDAMCRLVHWSTPGFWMTLMNCHTSSEGQSRAKLAMPVRSAGSVTLFD
jgi:hypothetical protein